MVLCREQYFSLYNYIARIHLSDIYTIKTQLKYIYLYYLNAIRVCVYVYIQCNTDLATSDIAIISI